MSPQRFVSHSELVALIKSYGLNKTSKQSWNVTNTDKNNAWDAVTDVVNCVCVCCSLQLLSLIERKRELQHFVDRQSSCFAWFRTSFLASHDVHPLCRLSCHYTMIELLTKQLMCEHPTCSQQLFGSYHQYQSRKNEVLGQPAFLAKVSRPCMLNIFVHKLQVIPEQVDNS